jgi:DNA-binding GntR family transcriptional regulator
MSSDFSTLEAVPGGVLLTDLAHEQIRRDILNCTLRPGSEISEAELRRRYGFGKAPVRAALHRLAQEGLVRAVPRRGHIVAPVTVRDIHELFEFRLLLEPAIVRLAAGRLTPEARRRLEELCRADLASPRAFNDANTEFHLTIARLAANRHMADALAQLLAQMERLFLLRYPADDSQRAIDEHMGLVEALDSGRADTAAAVATTHIERARQKVLELVLSSADVMSVHIT